MAGSPKKRARKEREAAKRLQLTTMAKADERLQKLGRPSTFNQSKAEKIIELVACGVPIEDGVALGKVIKKGIASRLKVHPATIYRWQRAVPAFGEDIARARGEASHRIADRQLALADVALSDPVLANACRVAADILRWQAEIRNPHDYGEKKRLELHVSDGNLAERLRRARERTGLVVEQEKALPAPEPVDAEVVPELVKKAA